MSEIERDTIKDAIFAHNKDLVGPQALSALVEQYKFYVDAFEKVVARRQTVHSFFLSVNVFVATGVGLVAKDIMQSPLTPVVIGIASLVGISLSMAWRKTLLSYIQLSRAKREVIKRLEQSLPAAIFAGEWEALGRGEDPKRYQPLTKSEMLLPLIFLGAYALGLVGAVIYLARQFA